MKNNFIQGFLFGFNTVMFFSSMALLPLYICKGKIVVSSLLFVNVVLYLYAYPYRLWGRK